MSYRDIYSALEEDLPKVRYRAEYMMPKIVLTVLFVIYSIAVVSDEP